MQRQASDWEKILSIYILQRPLSRIYKKKTLTITNRTNTNYKNEQTFNPSYTEIVYPLKDAQYHLLLGKWEFKPQCDITTYSLEH